MQLQKYQDTHYSCILTSDSKYSVQFKLPIEDFHRLHDRCTLKQSRDIRVIKFKCHKVPNYILDKFVQLFQCGDSDKIMKDLSKDDLYSILTILVYFKNDKLSKNVRNMLSKKNKKKIDK